MLALKKIFGNEQSKKVISTGLPLPTPNRMIEEYITRLIAKKRADGTYSLEVRTLKKSPPGEDGITSLVTIHNYRNSYTSAQVSKLFDDFKKQTAKGFSDVSFI